MRRVHETQCMFEAEENVLAGEHVVVDSQEHTAGAAENAALIPRALTTICISRPYSPPILASPLVVLFVDYLRWMLVSLC